MLRSPISHRFFRCFPLCVCVAFRIGFCNVLAISRLSAHAGFDLHLSFNSVLGFGGGDGGVGGWGDDVHAACDLCFLFLLLTTFFCYVVVRCSGGEGGGGGVMTSIECDLCFLFVLLTFFCYVVVHRGGEGVGGDRGR